MNESFDVLHRHDVCDYVLRVEFDPKDKLLPFKIIGQDYGSSCHISLEPVEAKELSEHLQRWCDVLDKRKENQP